MVDVTLIEGEEQGTTLVKVIYNGRGEVHWRRSFIMGEERYNIDKGHLMRGEVH